MNRSNNYEDDTSRIFNVDINQKSKTFRAASRRASVENESIQFKSQSKIDEEDEEIKTDNRQQLVDEQLQNKEQEAKTQEQTMMNEYIEILKSKKYDQIVFFLEKLKLRTNEEIFKDKPLYLYL